MFDEQRPALPPSFIVADSETPPETPPKTSLETTTETTTAADATPNRRWVSYGADVLLGLGLLIVGIPIAWLVGIGTARIVAAPGMTVPGKRMPLQEIILRRSNRVITEIQRLPSRWQPAPPLETRIEPIPIPTQPVAPLTPPPAALNGRDRTLAQEELIALQQEFETIRRRLFDLETKLGQAQSTADVESRLANLEGWLTPDQPLPSATLPVIPQASADSSQQTARKVGPNYPLLEITELKITLPSDALFAPGEARLLTTAPELLNSIFEDLAQYQNTTILIGSHTDDHLEPSQSVNLAFQQANALRAYLSGNLPNHRWVTLGYGQNQPITDNSTPQLRQRNRRIEISIDRR